VESSETPIYLPGLLSSKATAGADKIDSMKAGTHNHVNQDVTAETKAVENNEPCNKHLHPSVKDYP
jgi:hypothetical protein